MLVFNKNQSKVRTRTNHIVFKNQKYHNRNKEATATIFLIEDDETSNQSIFYTCTIAFAFLFLNYIRYWLENRIDDYLILACYAFFSDVTMLSFVICVVDLDEVRLAHVSYIRNSLEHSEKIPQPPFLT